ncbi:MAG: DNA-protecting protein DprA [Mycoplasmataceae bacterium]|nr:DNA-protecting protein DprA [Mycoplasmataceae bacterium]
MDILLKIALYFNGNWDQINECIKNGISDKIRNSSSLIEYDYCTLIDSNYPESCKHIKKPPYVLMYRGNLGFLNRKLYSFIGKIDDKNIKYFKYMHEKKYILVLQQDDHLINNIKILNSHNILLCVYCQKGIKTIENIIGNEYENILFFSDIYKKHTMYDQEYNRLFIYKNTFVLTTVELENKTESFCSNVNAKIVSLNTTIKKYESLLNLIDLERIICRKN